jgi:arachidonate 15-lipoxygenase
MTSLPTLPQNDPDPGSRAAGIQQQRATHLWDHGYLFPLAMLSEPRTENPRLRDAIRAALTVLPKGVLVDAANRLFGSPILQREDGPEVCYLTERFRAQYKIDQNKRYTGALAKQQSVQSADDFRRLFVTLEAPLSMKSWPGDTGFAFQRVAGMNPVVLRRANELPQKLGLGEAQAAPMMPIGATLAALAKDGRLFVCDYAMLDGIPTNQYNGRPMLTLAPIALFYADDKGALQPIAIQLGQDPATAPVITPSDDEKLWLIAKTYLQIADMNHHEMGTHLCRTHFLLEPFAVASHRQLSTRHPVATLLKPHLRILLFNNLEGRELLIGPKGLATRIMAGGNEGSLEIVRRAYAGHVPKAVEPWTFESWDLPLELDARGVGRGSALTEYPYRDDGLQLWNALLRYVTDYLGVYYATDADVAKDAEVQAWVGELASPQGGKIPRIVPPRGIAELATILTRIIFTCGPQHSAVNFAQYDSCAFAPNMAAAAYAPPPQELRSLGGGALDSLLLRVLPPPEQAAFQLELIALLTCYRFDRLGYYQPNDFCDPQTAPAIAGFQNALELASLTIATRNRVREQPYHWMKPENVMNSTSI